MTAKQAEVSSDQQPLSELASNPIIAECSSRILTALGGLSQKIADLRCLQEDERGVGLLNVMMEFLLECGEAMDDANLKPGRNELREELISRRPTRDPSDFDLGEIRAMRTAGAYESRARLESSGSKDSRMEAAYQMAAALEGLSGDAAVETIRKSIQRFRHKVRGTTVMRLNTETMNYEVFDAEAALLAGLPGKPGRPPKE